jgi:hypothetical protein
MLFTVEACHSYDGEYLVRQAEVVDFKIINKVSIADDTAIIIKTHE